MARLPKKVRDLLSKSKDAAILAVDLYNKPATRFKSYGYIVLMTIAWTSLLHAVFERRGIKYYHRKKNSRLYEKIDGERKAWDLSACAKEYFKGQVSPVKENIDFVIALRNKVEHHFLPALDFEILDICQALLINFEKTLVKEFGENAGLSEYLSIPIQTITTNPAWRRKALKEMQSREFVVVKRFIDNYRAALDESIWQSNEFSFQVYLVPNLGTKRSKADVAVKFVHFDPENEEEMAQLDQCLALFKEKRVEVVNAGKLKPSDVAKQISENLGILFSPSYHHAKCWRYYQVRPENGSMAPEKTDTRYCHYDAAHGDYLYTEEWAAFLEIELQSTEKQLEIFNKVLFDSAQRDLGQFSPTNLVASQLPDDNNGATP